MLEPLQTTNQYELLQQQNNQNNFEIQILNLRALKFARLLINKIEEKTLRNNLKIFVTIKNKSSERNKSILVECQIIGDTEPINVINIVDELIVKPPLSKFGIEATFKCVKDINLISENIFCYSKTNSYSFIKGIEISSPKVKVISDICVDLNEKDYD